MKSNGRVVRRISMTLVLALLASACSLLKPPEATVAPTDTPAPPAATEAPTADPGILYQDTFDDAASGWPTLSSEAGYSGYHLPGAYHIEVNAPGGYFAAFRDQDFADFTAEAQIYIDSAGNAGSWRHGLAFRRVSDADYYAFTINPPLRTWQVLKRANGAWQTLAEGGDLGIRADLTAANTLRVDAQGANLTFSLNGQPVVRVSDSDFIAGDFGFVVETFDQALAHVHLDSLVVRRLDPGQIPSAPTAAPTSEVPTETATATLTPTATRRGPTATATVGLPTSPAAALTAAAATAGAALQTAAAVPTQIPGVPTLPTCGLPGLPVCP